MSVFLGRSLGRRAGGVVLLLVRLGRDDVDALEPAGEIDVGAALGAEGLEIGVGGLAAERAALQGKGLSHVVTGPPATFRAPGNPPPRGGRSSRRAGGPRRSCRIPRASA